MTTFFRDTFCGSGEFNGHSPDVGLPGGGTWSCTPGFLTTSGGKLGNSSGSFGDATYITATPGEPTFAFTFDWVCPTTIVNDRTWDLVLGGVIGTETSHEIVWSEKTSGPQAGVKARSLPAGLDGGYFLGSITAGATYPGRIIVLPDSVRAEMFGQVSTYTMPGTSTARLAQIYLALPSSADGGFRNLQFSDDGLIFWTGFINSHEVP